MTGSSKSTNSGPDGGDSVRLTRIEEGLGFTERSVEQLSEEIAAMNNRLQQLVKRLTLLEDRLAKALEPDQPGDE